MLSIGKINNIEYYENLASEDYYTKGGEPQGHFIDTQGNAALGIAGGIQGKQLTAMLEGFNPKTGEALASNAGSDDKQMGLDLCFSAPKSVSVAWATSDAAQRQAISAAQQTAVERTLALIESRAQIRTGKEGVNLQSARIFAATFEHSTSRATDPQLHTHTLIAAHGMSADGSIKSLHTFPIMMDKKMLGAAYRAELAAEMQKLGYSIERNGESFDVIGSDKELEKEWSKRRQDIEQAMIDRGLSSGEAAAVAALATRETKENINRAELFEKWKDQASDAKLNFLDEHLESLHQNDALDYDAILEHVTDEHAAFNERDIDLQIMQELQGKGRLSDLAEHKAALLESGELIKLTSDKYTTKRMLELEKGVLDHAKSTASSELFKVAEQVIKQAIDKKQGISDEQQTALRHITGKGNVSCVIGAAGTGKSYMLDAARECFEKSGKKVIGCALSGKAAAELEQSAGIESTTIHDTLNQLENGNIKLDQNTVIVIDEAAMADTKLLARISDHAQAADAKLVLVGDTSQLQSIGAGGLFGKLANDTNAAEILTVRRQEKEWSKQAANDFRAGNATAALATYDLHDALHIDDHAIDSQAHIVQDFLADDNSMQEKLMIASKNDDVNSINLEARKQLKASHKLQVEVSATLRDRGRDGTLKSTTKLDIAEGERLRLRANNKVLGVMNGDLCTVNSIKRNRQGDLILKVTLDRADKQVQINTSVYAKMQHGYCITAHASQGATVNNVYAYNSSFNNKELAYVSQSRHRHDAHIYAAKEDVGDVKKGLADTQRLMQLQSERSSEKISANALQEQERIQQKRQMVQQRIRSR